MLTRTAAAVRRSRWAGPSASSGMSGAVSVLKGILLWGQRDVTSATSIDHPSVGGQLHGGGVGVPRQRQQLGLRLRQQMQVGPEDGALVAGGTRGPGCVVEHAVLGRPAGR